MRRAREREGVPGVGSADAGHLRQTATVDRELGFLQLCAERRFHRVTMQAFEQAAGLAPDEYWIEARAGGAPSWDDNTRTGRTAFRIGARHMGWAAHGATCLRYPDLSDAELRRRLERVARRRVEEFPAARHYLLFALPEGVDVVTLGRRG
jgi:hypothetical protein